MRTANELTSPGEPMSAAGAVTGQRVRSATSRSIRALDAACDVMSHPEQAAGELTYRSLWKRDDDAPANAAARSAREAERLDGPKLAQN